MDTITTLSGYVIMFGALSAPIEVRRSGSLLRPEVMAHLPTYVYNVETCYDGTDVDKRGHGTHIERVDGLQ